MKYFEPNFLWKNIFFVPKLYFLPGKNKIIAVPVRLRR